MLDKDEIAKLIEQRSNGVLQFHVALLYALDRVAKVNPA